MDLLKAANTSLDALRATVERVGDTADEQRAAVVAVRGEDPREGSTSKGFSLLIAVLAHRIGDWLERMVWLLQVAGDDESFVNARTERGTSALWVLAANRGPAAKDTPSERQQLAAVAALLLYGADATVKHKASGMVARDAHQLRGSHQRPEVLQLLEKAEHVGGPRAVEWLLSTHSATLLSAPGWDAVKELPAVRAAVATAHGAAASNGGAGGTQRDASNTAGAARRADDTLAQPMLHRASSAPAMATGPPASDTASTSAAEFALRVQLASAEESASTQRSLAAQAERKYAKAKAELVTATKRLREKDERIISFGRRAVAAEAEAAKASEALTAAQAALSEAEARAIAAESVASSTGDTTSEFQWRAKEAERSATEAREALASATQRADDAERSLASTERKLAAELKRAEDADGREAELSRELAGVTEQVQALEDEAATARASRAAMAVECEQKVLEAVASEKRSLERAETAEAEAARLKAAASASASSISQAHAAVRAAADARDEEIAALKQGIDAAQRSAQAAEKRAADSDARALEAEKSIDDAVSRMSELTKELDAASSRSTSLAAERNKLQLDLQAATARAEAAEANVVEVEERAARDAARRKSEREVRDSEPDTLSGEAAAVSTLEGGHNDDSVPDTGAADSSDTDGDHWKRLAEERGRQREAALQDCGAAQRDASAAVGALGRLARDLTGDPVEHPGGSWNVEALTERIETAVAQLRDAARIPAGLDEPVLPSVFAKLHEQFEQVAAAENLRQELQTLQQSHEAVIRDTEQGLVALKQLCDTPGEEAAAMGVAGYAEHVRDQLRALGLCTTDSSRLGDDDCRTIVAERKLVGELKARLNCARVADISTAVATLSRRLESAAAAAAVPVADITQTIQRVRDSVAGSPEEPLDASVRAELDAAQADRAALEQQLSETADEIRSLQSAVADAKALAERRGSRAESLAAELKVAQDELERSRAGERDAEERELAARTLVKQLNVQVNKAQVSAKEGAARARRAEDGLSRAADAHEEEHRSLKERLVASATRLERAEKALAQSKSRESEQRGRADRAEAARDEALAEVARSQAQLKSLQHRLRAARGRAVSTPPPASPASVPAAAEAAPQASSAASPTETVGAGAAVPVDGSPSADALGGTPATPQLTPAAARARRGQARQVSRARASPVQSHGFARLKSQRKPLWPGLPTLPAKESARYCNALREALRTLPLQCVSCGGEWLGYIGFPDLPGRHCPACATPTQRSASSRVQVATLVRQGLLPPAPPPRAAVAAARERHPEPQAHGAWVDIVRDAAQHGTSGTEAGRSLGMTRLGYRTSASPLREAAEQAVGDAARSTGAGAE